MIDVVLWVAAALAAAALVLATYRLVRGPGAADRAVALDVLTLVTVPLMVGVAVHEGQAIYLDVALVYGVLAFLGVLALARYLDRSI